MQFQSVIGLEYSKKELAEMVQHNRLSHALMFLGREGNGALALARAFAQYIVCEKVNGKSVASIRPDAGASLFGEADPIPEKKEAPMYDSCGVCAACRKAEQLIHPDIHFSYPTVTKKAGEKPIATDFIKEWREFMTNYPYGNLFDWIELIKQKENSQGKITADECSDIIRKLSLKSFESEYKILIMWMPELMGNEGNKLLKLIEEPPANTLFILVTENESKMLPTIISRCQLVKVPALETASIEKALVERCKTDPVIAAQVAAISQGNYREALQQVQHADEDWENLLREWLNAILKNGPIAQTKWVDEVSALGREKQKQFLRYFNHLLSQAIRFRILGDRQQMDEKNRDFIIRLNKITSLEQQQAIIEELDKASYFIERNAHGKMLFHALTIKLYHIIQDKIVFLVD